MVRFPPCLFAIDQNNQQNTGHIITLMDSACSKTLLAGIARARIPPSLSPAPDSQTREWDILFTPSGYIDQVVPSSRAPTGDHNGLNPVTGVGSESFLSPWFL